MQYKLILTQAKLNKIYINLPSHTLTSTNLTIMVQNKLFI